MIELFNIKTIDDVDIQNKRILVKVDWNILNLHDGTSLLDTRKVDDTLHTLQFLLEKGNRLICVSHISKTKGRDPMRSIKPVANYIQSKMGQYVVKVIDDFLDPQQAQTFSNQHNNEILVLENIRYYPEEKKNDPEFVRKLSSLAEVYVNDAFSADHREHASVVGPTQYLPSYAGFSLKAEVESLGKCIKNPDKPLTFIVGGSKISTKTDLVRKVMSKADTIVLGGALANTFLHAQGHAMGKSLYEQDQIETAKEILNDAQHQSCTIILPFDVVAAAPDSDDVGDVYQIDRIPENTSALDIGPETIKKIQDIIQSSRTIVWNGPVGFFEKEAFKKGTDSIYEAMTQAQSATTIIGGGDTLTAIKNKQNQDKISHISTGGGAMLTFIEKGTLPGIEALIAAQSHS